MAGISKTAGKLGNMMYSRRLINCPDKDYVFGEDSKKEMKQEKVWQLKHLFPVNALLDIDILR